MSEHPSKAKIGLFTATIIGMNAMIGAGIFTIPSALTANIGPIGLCSFLLVAAGVWCLAQSFARVAQLFPQEGSFYTYASQSGGHMVGMIAAGCYLIGLLIAMGLLTHAAGSYLHQTFPTIADTHLALIALVFLVLLNMNGVSLSSAGQNILIACTVFPLIATTILCLTKANIANLHPFAPYGIAPMFSQMHIVLFSFFGFESAASLFNVIERPAKNLPKAIAYSVLAVALIYLSFIASLLLAIPADVFATYEGSSLTAILAGLFPTSPWLIIAIHLSCLSAILGTLHSMIWGAGALLFSFTKKMQNLPVQLLIAGNIINQKTSVIIVGLGIFASFSLLTNNSFFNLTALFLLVAFLLSLMPLFSMKKEWESGQNYITIAGIITAGAIGFFALKDIFSSFFIP